jgi:hypothetical protein
VSDEPTRGICGFCGESITLRMRSDWARVVLHGPERVNGPGGYQSFYAHLWCLDDRMTPTFQRYLHDAFADEFRTTGQ